jgi:hypothetical protein
MNSGTNTHFVRLSLSPDEEDAVGKNIVQLVQVQMVNFCPEQGQILLICKNSSKTTSVADPGCLSRIPDPDFYPSRIPDPGSRIQKQ